MARAEHWWLGADCRQLVQDSVASLTRLREALERTAEAGRMALLLLQNCSLAHQLPDIPKNTFFLCT